MFLVFFHYHFVLTIKWVISQIFGKILEEIKGCALIKVFLGMLQDSEYYCLWPGEYQGHQPGEEYHESKIGKKWTEKFFWEKTYFARLLCFEVFIEESGLKMLRYLTNKLWDFLFSKFCWASFFGKLWEMKCTLTKDQILGIVKLLSSPGPKPTVSKPPILGSTPTQSSPVQRTN